LVALGLLAFEVAVAPHFLTLLGPELDLLFAFSTTDRGTNGTNNTTPRHKQAPAKMPRCHTESR
jgi:hypothetical protein